MTPSGHEPPRVARGCLTWAARRLATPALVDDADTLFLRRAQTEGEAVARRWYRRQARAAVLHALFARSLRGAADRAERAFAPKAFGLPSWLDMKLGLRMMAKYPLVTVVSGFAIAVTVATAVGMFAVFQDFFLRPTLPLPEGERIVSLGLRRTDVSRAERRVLHDYTAWRDQLASLDAVGLWRESRGNLISDEGRGDMVDIAVMTASGFEVAGVPPLLGRTLAVRDEVAGAESVLVIGYDAWVDRFGADPQIVGRRVRMGYDTHTVVGVMPEGFGFPYAHSFWTPLRDDPDEYEPYEGHRYYAFARLAPGVTREQAQAEISALTEAEAQHSPVSRNLRGQVMAYTDPHTGMTDVGEEHDGLVRGILFIFSLVVLIPFANVAILIYARTATRTSEIAVRAALGASRARVVGQLFAEALVLAVVSSAVGMGLALFVSSRIENFLSVHFGASLPFWAQQGRSLPTVVYLGVLVIGAAVIVGVVPGLKATGRDVQAGLKRRTGASAMRLGRVWTSLVVIQVAITVALLPVAGWVAWDALGQGVARATFPTDDLLSVGLVATPSGSGTVGHDPSRSIAEVMDRVEREPGIEGVIASDRLPDEFFSVSLYAFNRIEIDGFPPPLGESNHRVGSARVEPGFFRFLGITVEAGRAFTAADYTDEIAPVIVNRAFVDQQLGGSNPIGQRVRAYQPPGDDPEPWREIVGVVAPLAENPFRPGTQQGRIFSPLDPSHLLGGYLTVRVPRGPGGFVPDLERIVVDVDPGLRILNSGPYAQERNPIRAGMRIAALTIALILLSVLVLCTAGVFALTSFNVSQRRREIGIRTALGGSRERVLGQVVSRSGKQLGIGVLIGAVIAFVVPPFSIDGLPVDRDPRLAVALAVLMVLIGVLATVLPVRRGLAIQPTECLREE